MKQNLITEQYLHINYIKDLISERADSLDDINEQMKKFFPSIWNNLKGGFEMSFPVLTPRLRQEEIRLQRKIKGLNIKLRLNSHTMRNAWTYPGLYSTTNITAAEVFDEYGFIAAIVGGYKFIADHGNDFKNIKPGPNKTVVFPSSLSNIYIQSWLTKGLYSSLSEEERTAVILHEIGHWAHLKQVQTTRILALGLVIPVFMFVALVFFIISSRKQERLADSFAKQCGYGPELASALEGISIRVRKEVMILTKIGDYILKFSTHLDNIIQKVLPIGTYPSLDQRRDALLNDSLLVDGHTYEDYLLVEAILTDGKILNIFMKIIGPLIRTLDKKIAGSLYYLFPMKR